MTAQMVFALLVYLFGAIPFGFLISRVVGKADIRKSGSGNIGATNVTRILGFKWGALSFFLDFLKGFLPYWFASRLFPGLSDAWLLWLSFPAILGHNFSPFLGFKGGKGVSTTAGLLIAFSPILGLWCFLVWFLTIFLFGYVSLASIIGLMVAPIVSVASSWPTLNTQETLMLLAIFILAIFQHRSNIQRLLAKKEKRMFSFSLFKL